jgi:hypothetical protein
MTRSASTTRRAWMRRAGVLPVALAAPGLGLVAGCGTSALPPLVLLRLPVDAVGAVGPEARLAAGIGPIELQRDIGLPGHLDRDAVLVSQGRAALVPLDGLRWAEPLRDAVPRLLAADLARSLQVPVWLAPAPAAGPPARPSRRLRVMLSGLDLSAAARSLEVRAEWHWLPGPAQAHAAVAWSVPVDRAAGQALGDAVALAHRAAVMQLAQRIAASIGV